MNSASGDLDRAVGIEARDLAQRAAFWLEFRDGAAAYPLADRLCRLPGLTARRLLLRAESHRLCGRLADALTDLRAALARDPTDRAINAAAMDWGDPPLALSAADRELGWERGRDETLRALKLLNGGGPVARLKREGGAVRGSVAWPVGTTLRLAPGAGRVQPDPAHAWANSLFWAASIDVNTEGSVEVFGDEVLVACVGSYVPASAPPALGSMPRSLTVIVPVYDDLAATVACLRSLQAQLQEADANLLVVDDGSPDAALSRYLGEEASAGRLSLLRNEVNLGFAATVNRALAACPRGDVAIVNADAWLPPTALRRLGEVARSDPSIGTVTPLSNNGELTSYPAPFRANPPLEPEEIMRLDALARQANGAGAIDLPSGVGFCLYVTRGCLEAVGPLPTIYLRGYGEDLEFCLRAREKGFRNVAAIGVFVGHAGSLSFREAKRALVVRNLALLEKRFPGYRDACDAFVRADPLRAARGAIEAQAPPLEATLLLVAPVGRAEAIAARRAREVVETESLKAILATFDPRSERISLQSSDGAAPQSLEFALRGRDVAKLPAYLGQLSLRRIEICDAGGLPEDLGRLLRQVGAPVEMACADLEWVSPLRQADPSDCGPACVCRSPVSPSFEEEEIERRADRLRIAVRGASAFRPYDRMAEAALSRAPLAKALLAPRTPPPGLAVGVPMPHLSPRAETLLLSLGRRISQLAVPFRMIVLGDCADTRRLMADGAVFVTGPMRPSEMRDAAIQHGIGRWLLPDRTGFFGLVDELAQALGAPKAYFDWSFGALRTEAGDLALDPRLCDSKAAAAVADWAFS